jgi:hypothetical protein
VFIDDTILNYEHELVIGMRQQLLGTDLSRRGGASIIMENNVKVNL